MYGSLYYGPQPLPWMATSTQWAPTPVYEGEAIAAQTSMTPFFAGNFVPVQVEDHAPQYLHEWSGPKIGDWLQNVVQDVTESVGQVKAGMKPGAQGNDVKALQQALMYILGPNAVGPKKDDGRYGEATTAGVKRFQESKGLLGTGWVDAQTAAALNSAVTVKKAMSEAQKPTAPPMATPPITLSPMGGGISTGQIIATALIVGAGIFALSRI